MNYPLTSQSVKITFLSVALLFSFGCADSLVFHERTKFSLNVEAKKSASEPVNLSLGYKRQLAVVAPSKNEPAPASDKVTNPASGNSDSEAVSMISTFNMNEKITKSADGSVAKGLSWISPHIVIDNNFATGKAAEVFAKTLGVTEPSKQEGSKESTEKKLHGLGVDPKVPALSTSSDSLKNFLAPIK